MRVEAEVGGGEVEDVGEKEAGMTGAERQGRTKLLKLVSLSQTAAHSHMTSLIFLTIASTLSLFSLGIFFQALIVT